MDSFNAWSRRGAQARLLCPSMGQLWGIVHVDGAEVPTEAASLLNFSLCPTPLLSCPLQVLVLGAPPTKPPAH